MKRLLLLAFLILPFLVNAQDITISGKVTAAEEPDGLPGVNVSVKGTTLGTITDVDGKYSLEVPTGSTLVFSFVGFATQEIPVGVQRIINVVMEEASKTLNEVVVTGYSSVQKGNITSSITSLKADDFKEMSLTGVDQALEGKAAGVQITQSSGTPGGGISVHIRGYTSINSSNRPLFIIDNVPVESGTLSLRDFGGQDDNALSLINPNDIESITILKDASAKAMYGSRASNGVIIITTKKGKSGQTRINFDGQRGVINITHKLPLLNSHQLLDLQREAATNAGEDPNALGLIPGVTDGVNTDWLDAVLRTGILQQYQLSASGGDNTTTFYMSGGYRDEQGVQLNNDFQRLNGNIDVQRKFTDRLTVDTNIELARAFNKRVKGDNFLDGVYSGAIKSLPYNVPYDDNGALVGPASPLYAGFPNFNPVAQALLPRFNALTFKMLAALNITYQITKNLSWSNQISNDFTDVKEDQYESSQTAIGGYLSSVGGHGYGVYIASTSSNLAANSTLHFDFTPSPNHKFNFMLGGEILQHKTSNANVQGRLFPSDDFTYITSAGIVDAGSSIVGQNGLTSGFGEARYSYKDRYLLTVGLRADGSSRFGPGNRFGYFPSMSAAWRISDEPFFKQGFIEDLKLRLSAGFTGNERIGDFAFLSTWSGASYNGGSGVAPSNLGDPNLKWESNTELDGGLDVSALRGRIQATADVYYNKSFGLLLSRPYPSTTGFGSIINNIGDMQNKGVELAISSVNTVGSLKWRTELNLSKNLNKVLSLADSIPIYSGYQGEGVDATNIVKVGQPLGTFWGLRFLGVDPGTGDALYEDINHDGVINNKDATVIGNAQPDLIGGITNRLSYGPFELSVFFQFSLGNDVLNLTNSSLLNAGEDISSNQTTAALRRWEKPGDITDVPRYILNNTYNNYLSSRFLENGSYLRLKNISLGYFLPQKIANRLFFERLKVYVSGVNAWTYTKYTGGDPEVSTLDGSVTAQGIDFFTLPQVRTILVGINATFK